MINSHEKSKQFPKYETGSKLHKPAHVLLNSDMTKLYKFFNPDINQICIFGTSVNNDNVPKLLEALGYDVTWEGEKCWTAYIPEEFRLKQVREPVIKRW